MRIGVSLGGDGSLDSIVQQARDAERDGFESAWLNHVFGVDALTALALAGRETARIELGTAVVPIYTQHPWELAQQAMTTQAAAGGRLTLGIGLSHKPVVEGMWGLSYERPARYMREYLGVLGPLVREGKVRFKGDVFSATGGLQIPGATPVPILVAALAPMMLRLAGEQAEGTLTWMVGVKTVETHVAPKLNEAAQRAGRPAPRVVVTLPVAITNDVAAARERASAGLQIYGQLENYRRMLDIEGAELPGDVGIFGTEAEVERQLRALASAGATDFNAAVFPAGDDARASIEQTRALLKSLIGRI